MLGFQYMFTKRYAVTETMLWVLQVWSTTAGVSRALQVVKVLAASGMSTAATVLVHHHAKRHLGV